MTSSAKKKCHVSFVISAIHLCLFEFVIQDQLRDLKKDMHIKRNTL